MKNDETKICWLCDCPLAEDEVQYCDSCNLEMLTKILEESERQENGRVA